MVSNGLSENAKKSFTSQVMSKLNNNNIIIKQPQNSGFAASPDIHGTIWKLDLSQVGFSPKKCQVGFSRKIQDNLKKLRVCG